MFLNSFFNVLIMKKHLNTPTLSSKKAPEESIRTIQKQPNPPTNISEATPKEDFKENLEIFPLISNRNGHLSSKDHQNFSEFKVEIEKKYKRSVMNKIYSFPRGDDYFSDNSSIDSLRSIEEYDLTSQNYERNVDEMKNSGKFGEAPNSTDGQALFEREIEKLNKEIDYYKNHRLRTDSKEKDFQRQNNFKPTTVSQRRNDGLSSKERPHYIKLLNLLEESNDLDLRKSENKRTPSNSHSCARKREISSKRTPNQLKTEKSQCTFDKKIAKTFENCCEIKENLEINIESDFRSVSRRRLAEASRSKSKSKPPMAMERRILSPVSYTYMNELKFIFYDKNLFIFWI